MHEARYTLLIPYITVTADKNETVPADMPLECVTSITTEYAIYGILYFMPQIVSSKNHAIRCIHCSDEISEEERKIVPSKTNIRIMKSNKIAIERRDRHVDKKTTHFVVPSRWYYHDYILTFFVK